MFRGITNFGGGHGNTFLKNKQNANLAAAQGNNDEVYGMFSKKKLNFEQLLKEDEFEEPEGLEQGLVTKFIFNKLTRCEMSCSCFIIISHICSTIDYELSYLNPSYENQDIILTLISSSTVILIILSFLRYKVKMELDKERNVLSKRDTGLSASYRNTFIAEILILIFHPNNWFKGTAIKNSVYFYQDKEIEYQLNHLMTFILHFRIIFLIRNIMHYTIYINPRSFRLCKIYGCECGYLFGLKSLIKLRPTLTLTFSLLTSIFFFASLIRIAERPTELLEPDNLVNHIGFFENSLWVTVVTLTTIGYGDIYIKTSLGRTIIFFLGFWGIFVISLFVVTIRNVLEISNEENRTLNLLLRLNYRDALRKEAAKVITTFAKVRSNKRRFSGVKSKQSMLNYKEKISMIKLKRFMNKFSQTQKKLSSTFDAANICEEFTREFEILWLEYNECKFNQENLMKKMGIVESFDANKNEKTQQASWKNVEEIGSNETIRRFPEQNSAEISYKGRKISVERKLVQDIDEYFRLVPDHQK